MGHVSGRRMRYPALPHAPRSYTVCDILQSKFHDIVLPGLGLSGADKDNERFKLECLIRDVLVTRNWVAHGKLSVAEVKRGMQSLARLLRMLRCDAHALESVCGTIHACINHVDQSSSASYPCSLSLGSLSRLLLLRHCQRFCDAVGEAADMQKAVDRMARGTSTELDSQKLFVIKGRHDLYHGVSSGGCMSVLVALCALSALLRNLGPEHAAAADSCTADVLQLLQRMQLCEEGALVAAVAESHRST
jgi:hypothetical protein